MGRDHAGRNEGLGAESLEARPTEIDAQNHNVTTGISGTQTGKSARGLWRIALISTMTFIKGFELVWNMNRNLDGTLI